MPGAGGEERKTAHSWDYARVGFSPGEFLDFVLGWFGVDIAGDDRATREHLGG